MAFARRYTPVPPMPARTSRWSRAQLVAELRRLERASPGPVRASDVRARASLLYREVLRHFGSMAKARSAAGLVAVPSTRKRWTPELVIAELRRLHRRGVPLTLWSLRTSGLGFIGDAARTWCGGIVRARRLAGLPEPRTRWRSKQAWDEDRVVEAILDRK